MDENCWKGLYKGYKCFQLAKNSRKCPEMVESLSEIDKKLIEIAKNGLAIKFYVEYQCHVQSYAAAAMPGRISDFGIPFLNWRALLSRHQLGATRLTVCCICPDICAPH